MLPTIPACALRPGDVTDVLGESLHILRVDPARPGWVRIVGRLGAHPGEPDTSITIPAQALALVTRKDAA